MHKVLLVRDTTNNIALLQHCDACLHLMLPFLCHLAIKWLVDMRTGSFLNHIGDLVLMKVRHWRAPLSSPSVCLLACLDRARAAGS
jgi:hypothetical protein